MRMSLLLGWGAYAWNKNTSARLFAKKPGGLMHKGRGGVLWDITVLHNMQCLSTLLGASTGAPLCTK